MAPMTTTIRAREPRDLLALIPFQLGFRPARSLVAVSVRGGPRGRVGLVVRVDLDDVLAPGTGGAIAVTLAEHLVRDGADRTVVVVYAESDAQATQAHATFADAAEPLLGPAEGWVVTPTGWYGLACRDVRCCPPGGRPLADIDFAPVSAEMVLRGSSVAHSRAALGAVGDVTPAARRSARRAAERWSARREVLGGRLSDARWREEGLDLWLASLDGLEAGRPAPEVLRSTTLGRLRAALDDVLVRDAVLLTLVPDHEGQRDLPRRVLVRDPSADVGTALRALTDPERGLPPGAARSDAAAAVLRGVAAHTGPEGHAPALTLLAVLAWWAGDGARASVLVERAARARPGYRLATLVGEALGRGVPPGWLAPRPTEVRTSGGPAGDP